MIGEPLRKKNIPWQIWFVFSLSADKSPLWQVFPLPIHERKGLDWFFTVFFDFLIRSIMCEGSTISFWIFGSSDSKGRKKRYLLFTIMPCQKSSLHVLSHAQPRVLKRCCRKKQKKVSTWKSILQIIFSQRYRSSQKTAIHDGSLSRESMVFCQIIKSDTVLLSESVSVSDRINWLWLRHCIWFIDSLGLTARCISSWFISFLNAHIEYSNVLSSWLRCFPLP